MPFFIADEHSQGFLSNAPDDLTRFPARLSLH
jgi:hypothetical protein